VEQGYIVINKGGKEAVLAILGPSDFFAEGCMAGQPISTGTATSIGVTSMLFIEKKELVRAIHTEHTLSDLFISHILTRNIRIEEALIDQLLWALLQRSTEEFAARSSTNTARCPDNGDARRLLAIHRRIQIPTYSSEVLKLYSVILNSVNMTPSDWSGLIRFRSLDSPLMNAN